MGRTAGALGPTPTVAVKGPVAEDRPAVKNGPVAEDRSTAAMSAVRDPAATGEGPETGEDGPWRTRGL